jgi:hypothetical protein
MIPILTCALAFCCPAGGGDPVQTDESVLATYDLRVVMPRWDASPKWSQSLLVVPAASPHQGLASLDATLEYADLTAFELLDLLTHMLGDELRREGRELMVEGHALIVLAPPALQEQVRSILQGLEAALSGTLAVGVDVLTLPEDGGELPPAGPLAEEEVTRLIAAAIARGAQHRSYQLELSAGRTARLDAHRNVPFLFDYDVEIAQASMVFAPVMSATREGIRLALRGLAVPGGLALSAVIVRSDLLGEIERQPLTARGMVNHLEGGPTEVLDGPNAIQSPQVLVRGLSFDTFLPDGKALALTFEAALGAARTRELVFLRRRGGSMSSYVVRPIPRTNRTLIALDADLFRLPRLRADAQPWPDGYGHLQPSVVAHFEGEPSTFLLEWMKVRFSVWRRFGPWILIVTDPTWDRDAAAQLDRLVKSLPPPAGLLGVAVDLRRQGREPAFPVRLRVPMLAGSSAGFVLCRGETAVTGFDVEVAQGASVVDPIVSAVFDGLALALDLEGTNLEARGTAQLFETPIAGLDPGYSVLGPIERPEPRVLRFDERRALSDGGRGPVRIGATSERHDQPALALEITVSGVAR